MAEQTKKKKSRKYQKGQAMIESVACMLVICLILFGLLQIFYLSVAQMFADYASFCSARSYSVGFDDYLTIRSAFVASIGASGEILYPEGVEYGNPLDQFGAEAQRIPDYITGDRWLNYGFQSENPGDEWAWYNGGGGGVGISHSLSDGMVETNVSYVNYPMNFPMRRAFTYDDKVNITGEARVMNHSQTFLEE